MKLSLPLIVLSVSLLFTGCGLIPKRVEMFQKKVKSFPTQTVAYTESQKQAAQLAKDKAQETLIAAVKENTGPAVIVPAQETAKLTDAVSSSLGPPKNVSTNTEDAVSELRYQISKLDRKIDAFKHSNDEVAGKKIEGTGLISVPYFVYLGGFLVVAFLGWHLAKTALTVASAANPGAAVAVGGMNVTGAVAAKAAVQVVNGGKSFLAWVQSKESQLDPILQAKIADAFTAAHKQAQDTDVQALVKPLVK